MTSRLFGLLLIVSSSLFAQDFELNAQKEGCRQTIRDKSYRHRLKMFSPILEHDQAEDLIDDGNRMIRNLKQMEDQGLLKGRALTKPWSDTYWPLYRGGLGQRYGDEKVSVLDWKEAREYVTNQSAEILASEGHWEQLSPAEKYDLLFGLEEMPLTQYSWREGQRYFDQYGKVETWMGLCHGWAAASMMTVAPKKKVEIETIYGTATFYPSDIKGLNTLLWAKGSFETRFIGGRCNSRTPRVSSDGRILENDCLDTNPGTWHLVAINQLGISKRAFIMDASATYEVWNQPVFSYDYTYFNPKTQKHVKTLKNAITPIKNWNDPRKKYRSPEAVYVVGVMMNVSYAVENYPSLDEDQEDQSTQVNYEYDLELDEELNIVGGEWYSERHPDFLWVPMKNSYPRSYADSRNGDFDYAHPTEEIKKVVFKNASYGLPWGKVVRDLLKRSAGQH